MYNKDIIITALLKWYTKPKGYSEQLLFYFWKYMILFLLLGSLGTVQNLVPNEYVLGTSRNFT